MRSGPTCSRWDVSDRVAEAVAAYRARVGRGVAAAYRLWHRTGREQSVGHPQRGTLGPVVSLVGVLLADQLMTWRMARAASRKVGKGRRWMASVGC